MSYDLGSVSEKSLVEVYHPEETLKSRFIRGRRKILNGRGVLWERMEARAGEAMTQELSIGDSKLTFAQANRQAMGMAQLQDIRGSEHEYVSQG